MFNFIDRQPVNPNRKKVTHADSSVEYVTIEFADNAPIDKLGTPLNREAFLAIQGFEAGDTEFNADGSITDTNLDGDTLTTVFNPDGTIDKTFTSGTTTITLRITFTGDGKIQRRFI